MYSVSPENRPKIDQVVQMINQVPSESSMDIHLKAFDCNVAKIAANDANFPKLSHPDNDGSNACAFLRVQIADKIHCLHQDQKRRNSGVWQCICDVAERVITESPRLINPHRKVEEFYDAQSAYKLIKNIGVPIDEYEFSEEFVTGDYVFSWKGRENLMRALSSNVGLYTCHTVIFTIGFINECFFIVDTHPIPEVIGGKGKGMLKIFPYETDRKAACEGMCQWIWRRLVLSGAKNDSLQSLAFMTKLSRYTIYPPSAEALDRRNESECIIPEEGKSFFGSNASKPDVHIAEEPIFEKLSEFLESRKNRKRKNNTPVHYGKPQEEKRRAFSRKRPKCETACLDEQSDLSHETDECWNNDQRIPMFEKSRTTRYTVTEALRILTESKALKCSKQPLKVRENASFLIDLKWFSAWEDIKADMNGVYNRVLRCGIWTLKLEDGLWSVVSRKKIRLTSPTMFHLVLNSKANKAQPALSKARERGNDDVGDLLKYARDKEDLVLHHSDVPEDLWVLGTSSMCSELERSTSSDILSHPFSVDPTFSLGKFEVTPWCSKTFFSNLSEQEEIRSS
ncbi:unnamed protein product [Porites lobata]|uniref:Uncharacterized protein n=1 Tax=Porites lobata TaxID=104759 RepID=A0ABN8RG92_9CNID|nr:unnamed protein product [Porites lobata]